MLPISWKTGENSVPERCFHPVILQEIIGERNVSVIGAIHPYQERSLEAKRRDGRFFQAAGLEADGTKVPLDLSFRLNSLREFRSFLSHFFNIEPTSWTSSLRESEIISGVMPL